MIDYKEKYEELKEDMIGLLGQILGECDLSQTDGLEPIVSKYYNDLVEEDKEQMQSNYDEYVVFVLGTDNFDICKKIRNNAIEFGMDRLYEICVYLATKFEEYDKGKHNVWSQYESLEHFLNEYEKEINDYLNNEVEFNIKGDK